MSREVKIGLTVISGILAAYLFFAWVKGIHLFGTASRQYNILFENVAGLKTNDPVAVFGYPAGSVRDISLTPEGAQVKVSIEEDVVLKSDAWAEIRMKELTGGKMIEVFPGRTGQVLGEGSLIRGKTALDFGAAFSKFGTFMDGLSPESFDSLFTSIRTITNAVADLTNEINAGEMSEAVHNLTDASGSLNRILSQVENRQLVGKVDSTLLKVTALSEEATSTIAEVKEISSHIKDQTLPQSDSLLSDISGMLAQTEKAMESVESLLEELNNEETAVGKMLHDEEFGRDLEATIDNLNKTLDHLRTKRIYVSMSLSRKQRKFSEEAVNEVEESESPDQ